MEPDSQRIAKELFMVQAEHLDPMMEEIRVKLLGSLATSSTRLDSLQTLTAERRVNGDFISRVRSLLPIVSPGNSDHYAEFTITKPGENQLKILGLLGNTVWQYSFTAADKNEPYDINEPNYIIGRRSSETKKNVDELLLLPALPKRKLRVATVPRALATAIDEYAIRTMVEPLTNDEIDLMYSVHRDGIVITHWSPRSLRSDQHPLRKRIKSSESNQLKI